MSFQSQLLQSTVQNCFCYRAQRCLPTRRWKARLRNYGLLLDDTQERLTNIRYADDLLLFARTFDEAVFIFAAAAWPSALEIDSEEYLSCSELR